MRKTDRGDAARRAPLLLLALGVLVFSLGVWVLVQDMGTSERYHELARQVDTSGEDDQAQDAPHVDGNGRDVPRATESARSTCGAIAWVTVEGTPIDLPVAGGDRGFDWYLHHDLWGNESELGCPFVDPRCPSPDNPHVLVYGHHLLLTDAMFSPLHRCYLQGEFDRLGTCRWTSGGKSLALAPLCALSVDQDWPDILRFSFSDERELREWLGGVLEEASARSSDASLQASRATRVLTLVTCSSELAGRRLRTLVLFTA